METKLNQHSTQIHEIRIKLLKEIEKYKDYKGYEYLKKIIKSTLAVTLIKIEEDNFEKIEKHIQEMHQEIAIIFQRYNGKKQQIRNMSDGVYGTRNKRIIKEYETLNRNFRQGQDIFEINEGIESIQKEVEEHKSLKRK